MTRHHRERVIKRRKKLYDVIWTGGWEAQSRNEVGRLAKYSSHHHYCWMCTQRYNRAANARKFNPYEEYDKKDKKHGWEPCGRCWGLCDCQWELDVKGYISGP